MNELDLTKPLFQLTAGEFLDLLRQGITAEDRKDTEAKEEATQRRFVYGIAGIAQLFNCSKTTANRIKASGKIDKAITQCGRMITVDADMALSLIKNNTI